MQGPYELRFADTIDVDVSKLSEVVQDCITSLSFKPYESCTMVRYGGQSRLLRRCGNYLIVYEVSYADRDMLVNVYNIEYKLSLRAAIRQTLFGRRRN